SVSDGPSMAVLMFCSSSICCTSVNYNGAFTEHGRFSALSYNNGSGTKVGNLKFLSCGSMAYWKKRKKKRLGFCGVAIKSQHELVAVKGKLKNGLSSEEVMRVLKSILDPSHAFSYFKSVAELPSVVHTTETCNHMLEILRVHRRVSEMAVV